MNQKQLSLYIRHAFSLTNAEAAAIKGANPAFARAMVQIRELVEGLPEADLLKASAWKSLKPQVMAALKPYNNAFRNSLYSTLDEIDPDIREYAQKSLDAVTAPAPAGTAGAIPNAPGGGLQSIGNSQLAQNTTEAIRRTSVANVKLDRLFRVGGAETDVSLWMKQNYKAIDRIVGTGIIQGASTNAIAAQISEEASLGGLLKATKGTAAGSIKAQAKTVARTAVQSFNHQVKEQVWDANADALEGLVYEWSAATDSRVCPTCGPLDGQKKPKRNELPDTPIHPNCRCGVVLVDPDDDDDVRTGIQLSETPTKGKGSYKTQVMVNGKKFYRKAVEIKQPGGTYADYLADLAKKDTKDSRLTLAEYFGGSGKAGQGESTLGVERAEAFRGWVKRGVPPDKALKHLVTRPDSETKLRAFKTKWGDIDPPKPKAPKPKPKPKPPAPKPKPAPKAATPKQAKPKATIAKQKAELQESIAKAEKKAATTDLSTQIAIKELEFRKLNQDYLMADLAGSKDANAIAKKAIKSKQELEALKLKDPAYASKQKAAAKADLPAALAKAKPPREALKRYTGESYREMRAEEFRAAKKAGKKLTPFEEAQIKIHKQNGLMASDANEIESFLKRAPKHKGEVYRTMIMDREGLEDMLAGYKKGNPTLAMESWTNDIALDFAQGRGQRITLRTQNKQGVDISRLSEFEKESEVLMPKGVKYKLKGVMKEEISARATKEGRYSWTIDLEQL